MLTDDFRPVSEAICKREIDGRGVEEGEKWIKKGEGEREGRNSSLFE